MNWTEFRAIAYTIFCKKCLTTNDIQRKICRKCGAKLNE